MIYQREKRRREEEEQLEAMLTRRANERTVYARDGLHTGRGCYTQSRGMSVGARLEHKHRLDDAVPRCGDGGGDGGGDATMSFDYTAGLIVVHCTTGNGPSRRVRLTPLRPGGTARECV